MRVVVRPVGVDAFDAPVPRIVLFVKWPLPQPYLIRIGNFQVFDDYISNWVRIVPHNNRRRNDRRCDLNVSQRNVFHLNTTRDKAILFNGPREPAL